MPLRDFSRQQGWLLPPTLGELVAEDHSCRFVAAFVDGLDKETWEELEIELEGNPKGAGAYHPRALLSVWIYGFMTGVRSSRKLEAACREQIPYMWLAGMHKPDHNTLWRFYKGHREQMRALLKRTVGTAVAAGLLEMALQSVDGTRIAGNAAKDRTFDAKGLRRLLERVEGAISDLEAQNCTAGDAPPPSLPKELASAEALRQRVKEALSRVSGAKGAPGREGGRRYENLTDKDAGLLNSRGGFIAGYNAQSMVAQLKPPPSPEGTLSQSSPPLAGPGRDEAPSVGPGPGMIITAVAVTPSSDDHPQLIPMIEAAAQNTRIGKGAATVTLADAGYHSGGNLAACASLNYPVLMPGTHDRRRLSPYHKDHFTYHAETNTYLCPEGEILSFRTASTHENGYKFRQYRAKGETCRACPAFGLCTKSIHGRTIKVSEYEPLLRRHTAVMATPEAKYLYRQRKQLSEPVFGMLKEHHAARRFLLRGCTNVRAEWSLLATAFNLKSLHRVCRTAPPPPHRPARAAVRPSRPISAACRPQHHPSLHPPEYRPSFSHRPASCFRVPLRNKWDRLRGREGTLSTARGVREGALRWP